MDEWILLFRLFAAGIFGTIVGLEREFRAKEAGVRTHFIVAVGSALFMVISKYAFEGHFDSARVAAQVVTGIGFIGGGIIIFRKNVVRGVTTAAGLWVVAAIGLACGAGMYIVSLGAAVMAILCLEGMRAFHNHYGERNLELSFENKGKEWVQTTIKDLETRRFRVESYSFDAQKVYLSVRASHKVYYRERQYLLEHFDSLSQE